MSTTDVYYSSNINYLEKSDEDLINLIKDGNKNALECLLNRYKELVNMKVSKYYIVGAEKEDIVQEGLIGLYKAIKCYKPDMNNSFKTFANICINRQLITAIKSSNRQKHIPLNSYVSLNSNVYEENEDSNTTTSLTEILNNNLVEDPLETIANKEFYQIIQNSINEHLSEYEKKVLNYYVQGRTYVEIAEKLNTPVKSIDNAIQRIRKKATKDLKLD